MQEPDKASQDFLDRLGLFQLAVQTATSTVRLTEEVHRNLLAKMGLPVGREAGRAAGLTGLIYKGIFETMNLVGSSLLQSVKVMEPALAPLFNDKPITPERDALVAVLNGLIGDRLVGEANPLATKLELRLRGRALNFNAARPIEGDVTDKPLVMVHGLCMNDRQWNEPPSAPLGYGEQLAEKWGYTPLYLRFNSGLHVSENGRELAALLERLLECWPRPISGLTLLGFSMGGLLMRSAAHLGRQGGMKWPRHLKSMVFLGSPHQGAALERLGGWLDHWLGSQPLAAPFVRLTTLRSAGIGDLGFGNLLEEDWRDASPRPMDRRTSVPLPPGVACYAIAGNAAPNFQPGMDKWFSDGLVSVESALGRHENPAFHLAFPPNHQLVVSNTHHLELMNRAEVSEQLTRWLKP